MKVRKKVQVANLQDAGRFWDAITDVIHERTKRVELNAEFLDGKKFVITAYKLNEQIPVRVDFKIKK